MPVDNLENDPDLIAWREERMNRHRRSSFEKDQLLYLRLNLPPANVNMRGSFSATSSLPPTPTQTPVNRRKKSLVNFSPIPRKRRLSRAGTKVADMVRAISANANTNQVIFREELICLSVNIDLTICVTKR